MESQNLEDLLEELENIKQENEKLKEHNEELISNEKEALDNLDHLNKDNKKIRKDLRNVKKSYENQIQQLKVENECKFSTIIDHENTIDELQSNQGEVVALRSELEKEKKKRIKLKQEYNKLLEAYDATQQEDNFEENKIESLKVRRSSKKYKQKKFELGGNTIFIKNIDPLKSGAQVLAVPLSMSWNYRSGIAKPIIQAAGQEIIDLIEEIKAQEGSERVGTIEYTIGGEIEYLLLWVGVLER